MHVSDGAADARRQPRDSGPASVAASLIGFGVVDEGVRFVQKPFSVHELALNVREAMHPPPLSHL